ncbi:MAG TPA: tetratricopeptide repeat protein [Rhodopila sp.]
MTEGAVSGDGRALYVQGLLALRDGDAQEAAALLIRALRRQPNHHGIRRNLVRAFLVSERFEQVLIQANAALSTAPDDAELHFARGTALNAVGQHALACAAFARALALQPDHAPSWLNMANASVDLDDLASAESLYRTAIRLDAAFMEAHTSLAHILTLQGRLDEAIASCETAIRLCPGAVQPHWNLAIATLLSGNLSRGFLEYEWRRRHPRYRASFPDIAGPAWDGSDPAGQTILVRAEQGFGDVIQFARYLPLLLAAGGKPILLCARALVPLIRSMPGVTAISPSDPAPAYDLWIDQISLPQRFGTTLETIPSGGGYLAADPSRVRDWHARLTAMRYQAVADRSLPEWTHPGSCAPDRALPAGVPDLGVADLGVAQAGVAQAGVAQSGTAEAGTGEIRQRTIGIALTGNPKHRADRHRSIPADLDVTLPRIQGVSYVNLEHGRAERCLGLPDLTRWMTDYAETAALVANLDLVITVDTSIAHLAGALGKPVWILLPHAPDWRWLLKRRDSPWYWSARLFRQPAPGDWTSVLAQVTRELFLIR